MQFEELVSLFREKGIAGAGGAGFPSYAKLNKNAEILILNCAECEPLLKLHRQVLAKYAREIMSTLDILAKAMGNVKETVICLKGSYREAKGAVEANLSDFENMRLHILGEFYPSGDEVVTIYEATKRRVPPGKIPISVGVVVFNVETVYNMYRAINFNEGVTHKFVTVAGEVLKPQTLRVPIGTKVSELLEKAGTKDADNCEIVMGGPMTGRIAGGFDVVTKTTNAILVLDKNSYVINRKKAKISIDMKRAMSSCCQCSMCTDLCPRNLLGHPINPKEFMRSATTGVTKDLSPFLNTFFCSACGVCEMFACPQGLSARTLIGAYKQGLRANGVKPPERELAPVKKEREYRKVSMKRLVSRLGLSKYDVKAPLDESEFKPKEVKISLSQSIGAPSVLNVKAGDTVKCGQIVGSFTPDKLSVNVHSSVDGKVVEACDKYIIVR